ncbi:MAG: glycosyltransferase, partial [Pseudonocardiaceae bacterium]
MTLDQLPFQAVSTGKLRRSANPLRIHLCGEPARRGAVGPGVGAGRRVVRTFRPDVVLSTGGYVAVPVGLATRAAGAPLLVHEQTTKLGLANRPSPPHGAATARGDTVDLWSRKVSISAQVGWNAAPCGFMVARGRSSCVIWNLRC